MTAAPGFPDTITPDFPDPPSCLCRATLGCVCSGWQACGQGPNGGFHDASGRPMMNSTRFPNVTAMTALAHSLGLSPGFCECPARLTRLPPTPHAPGDRGRSTLCCPRWPPCRVD